MKKGFTLAEVLITLGIIGVVAALTAPSLVQNAGNAKTGPTLSKVAATIENANEQMLHDMEATDLQKALKVRVADDSHDAAVQANFNTRLKYFELLTDYVQGSTFDKEGYPDSHIKAYDDSGEWHVTYYFRFADNIDVGIGSNIEISYTNKGSFKGQFFDMLVDINGMKKEPNTLGKDVFCFILDNNGNLIPYGGKVTKFLGSESDYNTEGIEQCNEDGVGYGFSCTASIFENNLKVIYK